MENVKEISKLNCIRTKLNNTRLLEDSQITLPRRSLESSVHLVRDTRISIKIHSVRHLKMVSACQNSQVQLVSRSYRHILRECTFYKKTIFGILELSRSVEVYNLVNFYIFGSELSILVCLPPSITAVVAKTSTSTLLVNCLRSTFGEDENHIALGSWSYFVRWS